MLEADAVVAGLGIEPNVELAADAGLPVANGIVVDAFGRVGGREDVFAAGDVARFPVAALGGELRVEHEDHAKSHGRQVGANMAGAGEPYDHLPFFYSDLFDLGYEAVGELDPRLDTLVDWDELGAEATIYYLDREHRPRGVLLWNRFGQVDAARELIRAGRAGRARDALARGRSSRCRLSRSPTATAGRARPVGLDRLPLARPAHERRARAAGPRGRRRRGHLEPDDLREGDRPRRRLRRAAAGAASAPV